MVQGPDYLAPTSSSSVADKPNTYRHLAVFFGIAAVVSVGAALWASPVDAEDHDILFGLVPFYLLLAAWLWLSTPKDPTG